jgi:hypothetical protein
MRVFILYRKRVCFALIPVQWALRSVSKNRIFRKNKKRNSEGARQFNPWRQENFQNIHMPTVTEFLTLPLKYLLWLCSWLKLTTNNKTISGMANTHNGKHPVYEATATWSPVYFTTVHSLFWKSQSQSYITTDGQSVSMSWCRAQSGTFDQRFILSYSLVLFGAPSLTRGRVCHLSVFCLYSL